MRHSQFAPFALRELTGTNLKQRVGVNSDHAFGVYAPPKFTQDAFARNAPAMFRLHTSLQCDCTSRQQSGNRAASISQAHVCIVSNRRTQSSKEKRSTSIPFHKYRSHFTNSTPPPPLPDLHIGLHEMAHAPRLLLVMLLLFAVSPAPSLAAKFVVGDREHWAPNVNYTAWADQHQFHVGDWLDFEYEKDRYDVVQVNETAYAACDDGGAILRYSRGRNFAFHLNRTGRFYFICSRGYCWGGMKVSVLVQPPASLPPAVAPSHASRVRAAATVWGAALAASLGAAVLGSLPFPM
ncbi:early nodulin-like protein 16 [Phragmites australis]|uniref:early nodulin-like protein 16 n=1 Tax=Phragmites australis TaxID=29695 RepID=UPI002D79D883|nr:early nodulin-like protein 16 [Phragmites australis]